MGRIKTQEQFVKRANEIHCNKYNYSKTTYDNRDEKGRVCIICPIHGEFWVTPNNHINISHPQGCKKCGKERAALKQTKTYEQFVEEANLVHKGKYNYDRTCYINNTTKIIVTCPIHGDFEIRPTDHLRGRGCPDCKKDRLRDLRTTSIDDFFKKCQDKFGSEFTIDIDNYINMDSLISVSCSKHGNFKIKAKYFIKNAFGCPMCAEEHRVFKRKKCLDKFIEEARRIHGDKYDYSEVVYENTHKPVAIICNKHGSFLQSPNKHLRGQGCPQCNSSHMENEVALFLENKGVNFIPFHKFDWLGKQSLDFYLPDYNIAIECQGIQHFKPVDFAGRGQEWANDEFKKVLERDKFKQEICKKNNVQLFYINYNEDTNLQLNNILINF